MVSVDFCMYLGEVEWKDHENQVCAGSRVDSLCPISFSLCNNPMKLTGTVFMYLKGEVKCQGLKNLCKIPEEIAFVLYVFCGSDFVPGALYTPSLLILPTPKVHPLQSKFNLTL